MVTLYDTYDPDTPRVHHVDAGDHPDLAGIHPSSRLIPFTHDNASLIDQARRLTPYVFLLPARHYELNVTSTDDAKRRQDMLDMLGSYTLMDSSMYKAVQSILLWQQITQPDETPLECILRLSRMDRSPMHQLLVSLYADVASVFAMMGVDAAKLLLTFPLIGHPYMWHDTGLPGAGPCFDYGIHKRITIKAFPGGESRSATPDEMSLMSLEPGIDAERIIKNSNLLSPVAWVFRLAQQAWADPFDRDDYLAYAIKLHLNIHDAPEHLDTGSRAIAAETLLRMALVFWLTFDYPGEYLPNSLRFDSPLLLTNLTHKGEVPFVDSEPEGCFSGIYADVEFDEPPESPPWGYWLCDLPGRRPFDSAISNTDYRSVVRNTPLDKYLFGTTSPPKPEESSPTIPGPVAFDDAWEVDIDPLDDEGHTEGDSID